MSTAIRQNTAEFTTDFVAKATRGSIVSSANHERDRLHRGVTTDSRAVTVGGIFVALRGEQHDGHKFVDGAANKGATLVVVQKGYARSDAGSADVIEVDDTLIAWGDLAGAHVGAWKKRGGKIVAITGSAGKTTTRELCSSLLLTVGSVRATYGNLNNRIGVPAVAFAIESTDAYAVFEMGMSERGEIERLTEIAPPDVAVITNVGLAHAGGVGGGAEDIAREKGAIFAALGESGVAIANADDTRVMSETKRSRGRLVTFGRAPSASYRLAARESLGSRGSRVTVDRNTSSFTVDLPLIGEAAAIDFVAALAAVENLVDQSLEDAKIASALASLDVPSGRISIVKLTDGTIVIDDSYNANPDSVRAALASLSEVAKSEGRRSVVVLGEMRELGEHEDEAHAEIGDAIVANEIALAISCGGLADVAIARAARAGVSVQSASNAENASKIAVSEVRAGDVVLVKGSRGVASEVVVEALIRARGLQKT
ncbi:MAG: UDP-N-acetylmuramoyl-tripeptide--D-alanyl-D-alanine ligase [Polyangiaceae bacterium]